MKAAAKDKSTRTVSGVNAVKTKSVQVTAAVTAGRAAEVIAPGGDNGCNGEIYRDTGLTNGGNGGIINTGFNTSSDPMREVFGSAENSHPEEIPKMIEYINSTGATLERPEQEKLCYAPGLARGESGKVYVSKMQVTVHGYTK